MTQQAKKDLCDVSVIHGGPMRASWAAISFVWRIWFFSYRHNLRCDRWYGVCETETGNLLAACGPFPGDKKRAYAICALLKERDGSP